MKISSETYEIPGSNWEKIKYTISNLKDPNSVWRQISQIPYKHLKVESYQTTDKYVEVMENKMFCDI